MTYKAIKDLISFELSADRSIPTAMMATFVHNGMRSVCMECVPKSLLGTGLVSGSVLRPIDDVSYIRMPDVPVNDDAMIDIDDMLSMAVVYAVCKAVSRDNKGGYHTLMMSEINDYLWAIYSAETCSGDDGMDDGCEIDYTNTLIDGVARYDIVMNQGADYTLSLQITDDTTAQPLDLTNAVIVWTMMRDDYTSVVGSVSSEATNGTGSISITEPLAGRMVLSVDKTFTATLESGSFENAYSQNTPYVYQLDVNDIRYMVGRVGVISGV